MDQLPTLIQRARQGELGAYDQLVGRYQDMAVAYAFAILGDFQLAEDAAQEAFVEAYRKLADLRHPLAFAPWLRSIVFKFCDRMTRQRHMALVSLEQVAELEAHAANPGEQLEQKEVQQRLLALVQDLPPEQRQAIRLFYFEEFSQRAVGSAQGTSVDTVKNRLRSARNRLKDRLMPILSNPATAQLSAISPQFLVDDLERSTHFYREYLGFKIDFVYQGFYAGISRDQIDIHLKCADKTVEDRHHRKANEHLDALVQVQGIDNLYAEFKGKGLKPLKELGDRPWGLRDFYVEDPDGYIICFGEQTSP